MTDYETAYRALREGLEALHARRGGHLPLGDWCEADGRTWPCPTIALLASSPAEGVGGAGCELEVFGRLDGIAEWCATHHFWMTKQGCPAVVTPSTEGGE